MESKARQERIDELDSILSRHKREYEESKTHFDDFIAKKTKEGLPEETIKNYYNEGMYDINYQLDNTFPLMNEYLELLNEDNPFGYKGSIAYEEYEDYFKTVRKGSKQHKNDLLRQEYNMEVENGNTTLSFKEWKSNRRKKKINEQEKARVAAEESAKKAKELETRISTAQENPLYKTVHDAIGDSTEMEEAQKLLNKFGKNNHIDPSELKSFLRENEDTFFSPNGRVPFFPNMNNNTARAEAAATSSTNTSTGPEIETPPRNPNTGESNSSKKRKARAEQQARATQETIEEVVEQTASETIEDLGPSNLKKIFNKRTVGVGLNAFFAINDFKDAREEGKGVVRSVAKAGSLFVAGEMLGGYMLPIMLAKSAPQMAVNAVEGMQRMTRQMNSVQRIQTFGESYFQDTQQLSTMRQAGMEMAKMSQYNLQQSIMGNEAQHMHRI